MRSALLVACLVACSHASAPPATPPPVTFTPRAGLPPLPPVGDNKMGWPTWSHERKLAYMKDTVMAAEREIFTRFEPYRFASMTCETCHGEGARDGTYKMPNPDLPHLTGGAGGFTELAKTEPEALRFMSAVVAPETAKLLGYPQFDMARHVGFSCYQCHVRDDVKD